MKIHRLRHYEMQAMLPLWNSRSQNREQQDRSSERTRFTAAKEANESEKNTGDERNILF